MAEAREGGASVSSPSSSAKLRSFGGFLGLAEEEEGGLMVVAAVVEGVSLESSSLDSAPRRRKLRDLAVDMARVPMKGGQQRRMAVGV